jgi:hypothetical protein
MGFDPYNHSLKIQESIWDSNSHNGSLLVGAQDVTPWLPSWPTTLQALG